jgi:hypothetical protein
MVQYNSSHHISINRIIVVCFKVFTPLKDTKFYVYKWYNVILKGE